MKKEIATAWVAALRSGKYSQTKGKLTDGDGGYCCLGVLCDISGLGIWKERTALNGYSRHQVFETARQCVAHVDLPSEVQNWAGMGTPCGDVLIHDAVGRAFDSLAEANDEGVSFETIADYIEAHYETL